MPFGKYRGWAFADIPTPYLEWLADRDLWPDTRRAVLDELDRRGVDSAEPEPMSEPASGPPLDWRGVLDHWYRAAARQHHPDRGGSTEVMQVLNDARLELEWAFTNAERDGE